MFDMGTSLEAVKTKDFCNTLRSIVNFTIPIIVGLGFAYMTFWLGVKSDPVILESGQSLFQPLAQLLNPNDTSIDIYFKTAVMCFAYILPATFAYYFINKYEEAKIDKINKNLEAKRKLDNNKKYLQSLQEFETISNYSICLSIDYETNNGDILKIKQELNKNVFDKLNKILKNAQVVTQILSNDVFIVTSNKFGNYDTIYDTILKALSLIRTSFKNKGINMIPSITSDASRTVMPLGRVRQTHFDIQAFNFKNRACSTELFHKKYTYLKRSKYAGVPIGEYAFVDKNNSGSYELNIVYKNLTKTLDEIR